MDKERARKIVESFTKELPCPICEVEYVGVLDGLLIFYLEREHHGKHIGWPIYCSVNKNGKVEKVKAPFLFKVMKMENQISSKILLVFGFNRRLSVLKNSTPLEKSIESIMS